MKTLTKRFEFDAAHRIMDEKVKCFNLHGHRFAVDITFSFEHVRNLGYAVDFKELKEHVGGMIDKNFDHACILNPADREIIDMCDRNGWKYYVVGGGSFQYINPTAENLSYEIYTLTKNLIDLGVLPKDICVQAIRLYETPTCWVERTYNE